MGNKDNWDFEVEKRNNLPRKPKVSMPRRRDVREESWDDERELVLEHDEFFLDLPLQIFRRLPLCRFPPLAINTCCLNLFLVPQWPVCSPS